MKNMEDVLTRPVNRRSFIKNGAIAAGAATVGAGLLSHGLAAFAQDTNTGGSLTPGDIAILRFLAAAELIETDLWIQYAELGGIGNLPLSGACGRCPDEKLNNRTSILRTEN